MWTFCRNALRPITTARLQLRPIAAGDATAIFKAYARDPAVTRYLTWRPHDTLADTEAYVATCLAMPPARERVYALTGRSDGALMGALHLRRPVSHRIAVGYVLARPQWGLGLMTEAFTGVVSRALCEPGVFRVEATCDVDNPGSAKVLEKAGFGCEGLLKRWLVHPNLAAEPRACFIYALTR